MEEFIAGDIPVIYMSLGSIARSSHMPGEYKKIIVQALSKLPYKVLWKYEDDSLGEIPENIMIRKWMPQQDVLGAYSHTISNAYVKTRQFKWCMYTFCVLKIEMKHYVVFGFLRIFFEKVDTSMNISVQTNLQFEGTINIGLPISFRTYA